MQHTAPRALLVAVLACALGCSSPGEPYRYHNVKIYPALAATATAPNTQTDVTLTFGLFNTDVGATQTVTYTVTRTDVYGATVDVQAATTVDLPVDGWKTVSLDLGTPVSAYNDGSTDTGSGAFTYTVTIAPVDGERDSSDNSGSLTVTWADLNLAFSSTPTATVPGVSTPSTITAVVACTDVTSSAIAATARAVGLGVTLLDGTDITGSCTITPASGSTDIAVGATQTYSITLPSTVASGDSVIITINPLDASAPHADVPESSRSDNAVTIVIPSTT